jgi:Ca2+-binding RTX toxin-like protein
VGAGVVNIQNVIGSPSDDTLIGNSTGNVLVGGPGNDTLIAGSGNSILIGGQGRDTLIANAGTPGFDILIGDATDFDSPTDANLAALNAFFSTWRNTTAANYSSQVNLLRNTGVTVGGTTYRLNRSTVHDDSSVDTMTGATLSQGSLDWFFQSFGDVMQNYRSPEIWT